MKHKQHYYMAVAASGPNTEILQFNWFINNLIIPVLPSQVGKFENALLMTNEN